MAKRQKDKISWLFNQQDARKAIVPLGAINLTYIEAVYITSDKEEVIKQYSDMVMCNSQQANQECILWMRDRVQIEKDKGDERYLYFRFVRKN